MGMSSGVARGKEREAAGRVEVDFARTTSQAKVISRAKPGGSGSVSMFSINSMYSNTQQREYQILFYPN